MTRVTQAKIGLALIALGCFFVGVRVDSALWRWIGIGCAASAWSLRFVEKGQRRRVATPEDQGRSR
jgi:hypothetical protein